MTKVAYAAFLISLMLAYAVMRSGNWILMSLFLPIAFIGLFVGLLAIWLEDNEKKKAEFVHKHW